jgi:hypothetical protein
VDECLIKQQKAVLKPQNLSDDLDLSGNVLATNGELPLEQEILQAMEIDAFALKILTML